MSFQTVNPATGKLIRTFEWISDRDLELAVGTAHKVYETDWRREALAARKQTVGVLTGAAGPSGTFRQR